MQRSPNDAHALSNLSIVDWAFNRLDASISDAEKAVAASPNSAEAHSKLADALGAKLVSSDAGALAKMSLAHRFRKEIDRTLELDPNDVDALQDLAQFYWHARGMVGGDKQKARQTADRLLRVSAYRGASARVDFSSDDTDLKRRSAAIQAIWRDAVTASPASYEARAALAAAYLQEGSETSHLADAEAEAKKAMTLDPARVSAYTTLAIVYARSERWSEAGAVLKQAQERVPDDRAPGYRIAVLILTTHQNQQLQRAEQFASRVPLAETRRPGAQPSGRALEAGSGARTAGAQGGCSSRVSDRGAAGRVARGSEEGPEMAVVPLAEEDGVLGHEPEPIVASVASHQRGSADFRRQITKYAISTTTGSSVNEFEANSLQDWRERRMRNEAPLKMTRIAQDGS